MLRWSWAHGYVSENVAGEGIDGALPAMPNVKEHFRALPYREVAAALTTVEKSRASKAVKLCLRFLILLLDQGRCEAPRGTKSTSTHGTR